MAIPMLGADVEVDPRSGPPDDEHQDPARVEQGRNGAGA